MGGKAYWPFKSPVSHLSGGGRVCNNGGGATIVAAHLFAPLGSEAAVSTRVHIPNIRRTGSFFPTLVSTSFVQAAPGTSTQIVPHG